MKLLDELTYDDLDEEQKELADCIGLDAYKKLIAAYAGSSINIRMPEMLTLKSRNRYIIRDFNGYNFGELSRLYGLTERQIRNIVSEVAEKRRSEPHPGQITFFDGDEEN